MAEPRPTAAQLAERVIDALVPALPKPEGVTDWHVPPTRAEVWAEVRSVCGPVRGALFIAWVVFAFPFALLWKFTGARLLEMLGRKPIFTALLVTVILGGAALYLWRWPGLLTVCLLIWLFTLLRQNQKPRA